MKKRNLSACLAVAALLSACIPSVNPFYTPQDVIYDSRLEGTWAQPDRPADSWRFVGDGTNTYTLTVTEDQNKSANFRAVLFNLKGQLYLDTIPEKFELKDDQPGMVGMSLISGHLLLRVREIEPQLKLDFFNWDWLEKYLKQNPKALAHRGSGKDDDPLVLTAAPRELQKFVLKHLKEGELFKIEKPEPGLVRLTNAPTSK